MQKTDDKLGEIAWCRVGVEKTITTVNSVRKGIKVYNMYCERCSPLTDIFPHGLKITYAQFKKGSFPCLCGKSCKLEDDQLVNHLNRITPAHYKVLGTNKLKGSKKKVYIWCDICSEDFELFPDPTFEIKTSHLLNGIKPCGCSSSYRYSDYEREVKARRKLESKGFTLLGVDGRYVLSFNPLTGNEWKIPFNYLSSDKHIIDPSLTSEKLRNSLLKEEQEHIRDFISTGKFHKDTVFKRSKSESKNSSSWDVVCGECGEYFTKSLSSLKRGQKSCNCSTGGGYKSNLLGNLYITKWFGFGESYLKVGVTNRNIRDRVKEQSYSPCKLDYKILKGFYHEDGHLVESCEKYIKESFTMSVCPKKWLPDGYTETVEDTPENLDKMLEIISTFNLKEHNNDQ